ncbi:hypothetical protein EF903_17955 [Streptomyces sp. WAC05292]|uniref:hypothetical protein n=1 Tax=Streptomyces sp. WAC05292 TaxID=2487418 RepID=UPI000F74BD86|nr:hypothetical protein [Streptomyces sp. WAC05292]RSS86996.1 hypothetical protein EF903_17955 [Streptomyces sp. WAC05292]
MALDTASVPEAGTAARLAADLRLPVWNALADRADALRRALPPRPEDPPGRWEWWRALNPRQARDAALLDRLDTLCGHLAGRPGPGYPVGDPLPDAALEEADGFTSGETAERIAEYRALRGDRPLRQRPPARPASAR